MISIVKLTVDLKDNASGKMKTASDKIINDLKRIEKESGVTTGGMQRGISGAMAGFSKLAGPIAVVGGTLAAAAVSAKLLADQLFTAIDRLAKLAAVVDVSVEEFQLLDRWARKSGATIDDVFDSMRDLDINLSEAAMTREGNIFNALASLNLDPAKLQLMGIKDAYVEVMKAAKDHTDAMFILNTVMGESASRLIPGIAVLEESTDVMQNMDEVISGDLVKSIEAFNVLSTDMKGILSKIATESLAALIPSLTSLFTVIIDNKDNIQGLINTVVTLANAFIAVTEATVRATSAVYEFLAANRQSWTGSDETDYLMGDNMSTPEQIEAADKKHKAKKAAEIITKKINRSSSIYTPPKVEAGKSGGGASGGSSTESLLNDYFGDIDKEARHIEQAMKAAEEVLFRSSQNLLKLRDNHHLAELAQLQRNYDEQLDIINTAYADREGYEEIHQQALLALEQEYNATFKDIRDRELEDRLNNEKEKLAEIEEINAQHIENLRKGYDEWAAENPLYDRLGKIPEQFRMFAEEAKSLNLQVQELAITASDVFADGFAEAFSSFVAGTESAEDAFRKFAASFLKMIAQMIIQQIIFNALRGIMGSFGGGGGGVASHTAVNGAHIGAGGTTAVGMATGGVVTKPTLALIGEGKESEAVLPLSRLESMMNNNNEGGGLSVNINVNVINDKNATDASADDYGRKISKAIEIEMVRVLSKETRPGGLLHSQYGRRM